MLSSATETSLWGAGRGVGGGQLPNLKTPNLVLPSYLQARAAQGHCPRRQTSHSTGWPLNCLGDPSKEWGRATPPNQDTRPIRTPQRGAQHRKGTQDPPTVPSPNPSTMLCLRGLRASHSEGQTWDNRASGREPAHPHEPSFHTRPQVAVGRSV